MGVFNRKATPMTEYLKVDQQRFEAYPGEKHSDGRGGEMTYRIAMGETRPVSDEKRELADRFLQLLDEMGLADDLAAGGLHCGQAIDRISAAIVTAIDESLPQYARKAVGSLARCVGKEAEASLAWADGAGLGNHTLRQKRAHEAERETSAPAP